VNKDYILNLCYFPKYDKIVLTGNLIGRLNKAAKFDNLLELQNAKISGQIGALGISSNYDLNLQTLSISTTDGLSLKLDEFSNEKLQFIVLDSNKKWE